MGSTKIELVRDLEQAAEDTTDQNKLDQIMRIIRNAERGMYHDFESELAAPKMELHQDLLRAGLTEIDAKMQNGDYDEPPTPEQEKELMDLLKKEVNKN